MATPKSTLWKRDPHTAAKHAILRAYLQAWFPILGRYHGIIYLDGFAGPGEYEDHTPGSPLVAIDVALDQRVHLRNEVTFIFIEADRHRAEHLRHLVRTREESGLPETFRISVRHGEFAAEVRTLLNHLDAKGLALAPTFAFIDPFGWKGLPMDLVCRLLGHAGTEAFINFSIDAVNRFIDHPGAEINAQMVELFGSRDVLTARAESGDRLGGLRELYGQQLRRAARYVRFFTMYRYDGHSVYDLFFATNNIRGLEKMKEAMWRADPEGHYRFFDATDPAQRVLFDEKEYVPERLLRTVLEAFGGRVAVPAGEVEEWTLSETPYLRTHAKAALQLGEKNRTVTVQPVKRDGNRRKAGTFPAEALVDFVPPPRGPERAQQGSLFG
jgi:three-Cys-motif partner protein